MFDQTKIKNLAAIAGLDISHCDLEVLEKALNDNLAYVNQIKEVDVTGIKALKKIGEVIL